MNIITKYLLLARNIVNVNTITNFIKSVIPKMDSPQGKNWVSKNLKNYIIKYGPTSLVKGYKKNSPQWLKKALKNKKEVRKIKINKRFKNEVNLIIAYLNNSDKQYLNKLKNVSYPAIIKRIKEEGFNSKATKSDFEQGFKIIKEYGGLKWIQLLSVQEFRVEGSALNHCIGDTQNQPYFEKFERGHAKYYSLRGNLNDSYYNTGKPICTIEIDNNTLRQIKGENNGHISTKYVKYIIDFVNSKLVKFTKLHLEDQQVGDNDLINIYCVSSKLKVYPVYKLPKNLTVDGVILSNALNQYGYNIQLPENLTIEGRLDIYNDSLIKKLGNNLTVGELHVDKKIKLPNLTADTVRIEGSNHNLSDLKVSTLRLLSNSIQKNTISNSIIDKLDIGSINLEIGKGVKVGDIYAKNSLIRNIPKEVNSVKLVNTEISDLPENFSSKNLDISKSNIKYLPEGIEIKDLDATDSSLEKLPDLFNIENINLAGSKINYLPENLKVGALNISNTLLKKLSNLSVKNLQMNYIKVHLFEKVQIEKSLLCKYSIVNIKGGVRNIIPQVDFFDCEIVNLPKLSCVKIRFHRCHIRKLSNLKAKTVIFKHSKIVKISNFEADKVQTDSHSYKTLSEYNTVLDPKSNFYNRKQILSLPKPYRVSYNLPFKSKMNTKQVILKKYPKDLVFVKVKDSTYRIRVLETIQAKDIIEKIKMDDFEIYALERNNIIYCVIACYVFNNGNTQISYIRGQNNKTVNSKYHQLVLSFIGDYLFAKDFKVPKESKKYMWNNIISNKQRKTQDDLDGLNRFIKTSELVNLGLIVDVITFNVKDTVKLPETVNLNNSNVETLKVQAEENLWLNETENLKSLEGYVKRNVALADSSIKILKNIDIGGSLSLNHYTKNPASKVEEMHNVTVGKDLIAYKSTIKKVSNVSIGRHVILEASPIKELLFTNVNGNLNIKNTFINYLPDNLKVKNNLLSDESIKHIGKDIIIGGDAFLYDVDIINNFKVKKLYYMYTKQKNILGLQVQDLFLEGKVHFQLPKFLKVKGSLHIEKTPIKTIPKSMRIYKFLYVNEKYKKIYSKYNNRYKIRYIKT
jgi:hypothetical protein